MTSTRYGPARAARGAPRRRRSAAFTIPEMVMVVLIAAIVLSMAVPNMSAMLRNNARVSEINRFVTTVNFARAEAIKQRSVVSVCESSDGASCATTGQWESGWIVFVNEDGDEPPVVDPGETVLKVFGGIDGDATLRGTGDYVSSVNYHSRGFTQPPSASSAGGAVTLCDDRGAAHARALIISRTGRPRLSSDLDDDGVDEDDAGNDLVCPS